MHIIAAIENASKS